MQLTIEQQPNKKFMVKRESHILAVDENNCARWERECQTKESDHICWTLPEIVKILTDWKAI